MEHLSRGHLAPETLARLVDEVPSPTERTHLNRCRRCRDELDALQSQTLGLSHLPDLRPPSGDWASLETRLRSEGLIRAPETPARGGTHGVRGRAGTFQAARRGRVAPGWQWAAAILLLVGGAGLGAGTMSALGEGGTGNGGLVAGPGTPPPSSANLDAVPVALGLWGGGGPESLEEAEELVRLTESWYRSALLRYREEAARGRGDGGPSGSGQRALGPGEFSSPRAMIAGAGGGDEDLLTRYIALEALLAAGQAAIREAPTDPFLNGLLVNMQAEREAALRGMRMVSREEGVWY
jgi:hypothetical protein